MRRGVLSAMVATLAVAMIGIAAPTVAQSPSEAPAAGGALTPVSVQLDFYPGTEYAPLQRGITKGYFAEQGIDLTIEPSTGSLDTLNSINSNKVQFAFVDSTTYTLQRIQKQSDTTGVYAYYTHPVVRDLVEQAAQQPRGHGRHDVRHGSLQRRHVRAAVPAARQRRRSEQRDDPADGLQRPVCDAEFGRHRLGRDRLSR